MNSSSDQWTRRGFCVYVSAAMEGAMPAVRNECGEPFVFATRLEAQREIADNMILGLQQFLDGNVGFADAFVNNEYIVEVDLCADGSVIDANGARSR